MDIIAQEKEPLHYRQGSLDAQQNAISEVLPDPWTGSGVFEATPGS